MRGDFTSSSKGATIMKITTVGMDLAKQVFQVHGVDAQGKAIWFCRVGERGAVFPRRA
jgi:hypothetical protein